MPLPPYLTSGASSRAHHALLAALDAARSPQEEDAIVDAELARLQAGALATRPAESLVILLHCAIVAHTPLDLDFALMPALHLVESGRTARDRRVGYTFLVEHLPRGHELGLLLVNTVRKSTHPAHVAAALAAVVHLPSPELAPAVVPLLPALAKHKSAGVRQRALRAMAALTIRADPPAPLPVPAARLARWTARETDAAVAGVLLRLAADVISDGGTADSDVAALVNAALGKSSRAVWAVLLAAARRGLLGPDVAARLPSATSSALYDAARLAAAYPPSRAALVPLVLARLGGAPNDHVVALRCLGLLPPMSWDTALGDAQMAHIMNGVHHVDVTIRRETLRLLARIDPALPGLTIDALLASLRTSTSLSLPLREPDAPALSDAERLRLGRQETSARALEAVVVASERGASSDAASESSFTPRGAAIAGGLAQIAESVGPIWEYGIGVVIDVLRHEPAIVPNFVAAAKPEPTTAAVIATIACEQAVPRITVSWLSSAMPALPNSVKELALIALVVLSADNDVTLPLFDGLDKRRHQVETVLKQHLGRKVVDTAKRRTLPDMLEALVVVYKSARAAPATTTSTASFSIVSPPRTARPLRYEAYSGSPSHAHASLDPFEHD